MRAKSSRRNRSASGRLKATAASPDARTSYPSVYDPAGQLAFDYGLIGLPTTFLVDRVGRIVYRFIGYTNAEILRRAIEDVLSRGSS